MFGISRPEFLSVPDAARELSVDASRVRALLATGQLDGTKVGGRWLVSESAIRERRSAARLPGRPLMPANAWGVLALASGAPAPWLHPDERRRLVRLIEARGLVALVPRLGTRADQQRFYGHRGVLRDLAEDPELVGTGASAARRHRLHLVPGQEVDAYAPEQHLRSVVEKWALEERADGANVRLRVVPTSLWPFEEPFAPVAAVAVDLMELSDVRAKRIGRAAVEHLDRERRWREVLADPAGTA